MTTTQAAPRERKASKHPRLTVVQPSYSITLLDGTVHTAATWQEAMRLIHEDH